VGTSRLTFVPDVSVGEWIAPRLGPFGGRVSSVVPAGFAAYARVLHPVGDETLSSETWVDVCAVADRQRHALMQWDSISIPHIPDGSRAVSSGAPWDGEPPRIGDLAPIAMAALCRVLASHTDSDVDIYFGLWEGWGWLDGGGAVARSWSGGSVEAVAAEALLTPSPPAFDETVMAGPRLHHPYRDYLLLTGPLDAATDLGYWPTTDWFIPQSPNLIWPSDHSWCVATEIDFRFTLVGGNTALIDAIVADPTVEAWPVGAADYLGGSDPINT